MSDSDPQPLEDLNLRTIRASNDEVDQRLSELEDETEDLREQVASLEREKEDLEEEKETATELLKQFRDEQKHSHLERIKQANAVVDEDEEVDLSALEEASPDVLETVADRMERLAEKASNSSVSNADASPNLSDVDPDDVSPDDTPDLKEAAEQFGLGSAYERVLEKGDTKKPQGVGAAKEPSGGDFLQEMAAKYGGDD